VAGPCPPAGRRIWDYVVARVTIDYRGALSLAEGAAVVRCQLQRIGRSSLTTREEVLAPDGRVAAEAEVVIVAWDPATGGSRPLTDSERAALERELDVVLLADRGEVAGGPDG
jgi:acyl-CoA thioesterase FadM